MCWGGVGPEETVAGGGGVLGGVGPEETVAGGGVVLGGG